MWSVHLSGFTTSLRRRSVVHQKLRGDDPKTVSAIKLCQE